MLLHDLHNSMQLFKHIERVQKRYTDWEER